MIFIDILIKQGPVNLNFSAFMTTYYTVAVTYTHIYKVLKNNTLCKTKYQICQIMRVFNLTSNYG